MRIDEARLLARGLNSLCDAAEAAGRSEIELAELQAAVAGRAGEALDELAAAIEAARRDG